MRHEDLDAWYFLTSDEKERAFLRQVVESNVAVIPCADGVTALRARTGVPLGLTVATDAFNRSYECNISEYKRCTADVSFLLQAQLDQGPLISMADTVCVDDHAGVVASADAELLEQGVKKNGGSFW